MTEELQRTCESLRRAGADLAILASVANVTYVTGVEVPIPFGALAELTYAPWLAILSTVEQQGWVVVPGFATAKFDPAMTGFIPFGFEGMDSFSPTDPRGTYLAAVEQALSAAGATGSARIAIESRAVPAMVQKLVHDLWSGAALFDAEGPLVEARWLKTEREVERIRRASHLADVGHNALARLVEEAGRSEIEMWTSLSAEIFMEAGRDIALSGELISGPRTATVNYPNGPWPRQTETGDAVLMDLSGRIDGYWFDCTNTHIVGGEPTPEQRRYARASQDACEAAMAALRPGARASDAFNAAKSAFANHGLPTAHYAGHQVGVTVNELPRLVPYDHSVIQPGMVFCVEPGAYQGDGGDFGARSEKMVLVREDGPEVLSTFTWGIR